MKKQSFIQGVATAGRVVFTILRVFSMIGAVCLLLSILTLSFLPANLFSIKIKAEMEMDMNLREMLGESWQDADLSNVDVQGGELTQTDDGVRFSTDLTALELENRSLALYLIPTLVQLLNCLFDGKTSSIRRFQALCNSVIVIDEVQTVPTKMLSLF